MKTMKVVMLFALLLFAFAGLGAQAVPEWKWAQQAEGPENDNGLAIAVDNAGNSYVTGDFYDTISFGDISLTCSGAGDIFICKLDADGNFLWAKKTGAGSDETANGVAVDSAGNCYVTGYFMDTLSFGATTLTSIGWQDIYVAKLGSGVPVDDPAAPELSGQSFLYPIWPNPCRQGQPATLKARVAESETAILSVYNLKGQLLSRRDLASGEHEISLDSSDLLPGLYFHRLETPSGVHLRKSVIVK